MKKYLLIAALSTLCPLAAAETVTEAETAQDAYIEFLFALSHVDAETCNLLGDREYVAPIETTRTAIALVCAAYRQGMIDGQLGAIGKP